jgi:hypothetical protein
MCDKVVCKEYEQCCAPLEPIQDFNTTQVIVRCPNKIFKGYHCEGHFKKANELYKQYKKVCNTAYKLQPEKVNIGSNDVNIIQENIKHLFKCHVWYVNAYKSRFEHRNYAFTPETSNYGHNKQFDIIQSKLEMCNEKLKILYDKLKVLQSKEINTNKEGNPKVGKKNSREKVEIKEALQSKEINTKVEIKEEKVDDNEEMMKEVNEFKKKQKEDEQETKKLIDRYINDNKKLIQKRIKIKDTCINTMNNFMRDVNGTTKIHLHYFVGLFKIIMSLIPFKFFNEGFIPPRKPCGCYVSFDVQLDCECIRNYTSFSIYMSKHLKHDEYIERLKMVCDILTKNREKIIPLYKDFERLYKYHGIDLLYMDVGFVYSKKYKKYELKTIDEMIAEQRNRRNVEECEEKE